MNSPDQGPRYRLHLLDADGVRVATFDLGGELVNADPDNLAARINEEIEAHEEARNAQPN